MKTLAVRMVVTNGDHARIQGPAIAAVPLASHPAMYGLAEKYTKLGHGGPNPFIDPAGYKAEVDLTEAMFHAVLEAQQKAASGAPWSGQ